MKIWTTCIVFVLLTLTACVSPRSASPTPTIVRLDRAALTAAASTGEVEIPPTATSGASATPTVAPAATTPAATAATQAKPEKTSTPTATETPASVRAEIVAAGLNVRQGPGMAYGTSGTVAKGDILAITGASADGNWLQIVTAGGQPGWISRQPAYTRVLGSLDDLPVVTPSATAQPSSRTGQSSTRSAQPISTSSSPGGRLVFATGSGGDLYVINADGTGLRKLAGGVIDPVVSPDGQQVAFTRWDGAEFGTLYVMNLASAEERAILNETRQAKSPTWSADGQTIVVAFQQGGRRDPQPECRTFDSDDGFRIPRNAKIISSHFNATTRTMSVCFIRAEDLHWSLRRVDVVTGKFEDLPADTYTYNPTWSPAKSWQVIYQGDKGLIQFDVNTSTRTPITADTRDTGPVFSPDGAKLALTYQQHDHWEVYTYDLASGSRQRLTKPPILADPQYSSAAPAWSPDGSQLAFITDRTGRWEIWVMNADGSNPHALFSPELQAGWGLNYQGMNERLLNWVK